MTPRPSTEQLLVQVLMRSAQEVLRALAECPDDASERERAEHELELAFAPIWSRVPYLDLTCLDDGLRWNDQIVLAPEEDEYELTRTLVTSGIHGVTLVPGAERNEMARFLELVDTKRRLDEDGDQDLVLMLFRADLHHIRYTVGSVLDKPVKPVGHRPAAPPSGDASPSGVEGTPRGLRPVDDAAVPTFDIDLVDPGRGPAAAEATQTIEPVELAATVRADARSPDARRGIVQLEKFDSTLYFLDQKEIEYLRSAIDHEYSQDHSLNVLALLLDILQLQSEPDVRDEVIGVLESLLPHLLGTGRFQSVAYLTSELRTISRETTLETRHKKALDDLRVSISETGALTQLFHMLDSGDVAPTAEELGILLREMSHAAIQTVLVWIGQLNRPEAKAALIRAIDLFFTEWPAALSRMTTSSDRTVVHRALRIANKLQRPDFVEPLGDVLRSDDVTTRRLVVDTLSSIGSPQAIRCIARAVDDPDSEVRTVAYRALALRPYRGAQKELLASIEAGGLESRDVAERKALFSAFGAVAGAGGVSTLEPILLGKGALGRRASSETRACAAVALGMINTPTARFALDAATRDRDPVVRSAAGAALRSEEVES